MNNRDERIVKKSDWNHDSITIIHTTVLYFVKLVTYRIDVIWTSLLNKTPPTENSDTNPFKSPDLSLKFLKDGQIAAKIWIEPHPKTHFEK